MSETKQTPLPWKAVNTPITWQIRDADDEVVVESWGYGSLPDDDAGLIVTSVNARPKAEELTKLVSHVVYATADPAGSGTTRNSLLAELLRINREVEAALKGEA